MNEGCPYNGRCPHIECIRQELHEAEENTHEDIREMARMIGDMKKTLYLIAGILFAELGVLII